MAAERIGIDNFKASNRWVQKFERRSPIQSLFKLHEKGGDAVPSNHVPRMEEIREISNIYKSRLFYRIF